MLKILKLKFVLYLLITAVLAASPAGVYSSSTASGWTIFRKLQSSQFQGMVAAAPLHCDIPGFLYNPAVLQNVSDKEISVISEYGPVGDKLGGILYCSKIKKIKTAYGVAYYDAGTVELNWIENGQLQTKNVYAQRDFFGIVSSAFGLSSKLMAGVSVKGARSELAQMETAFAFASDIGVLYLLRKNLSFSAAIQNLGLSTKFIDSGSLLPTSMYFGSSIILKIKRKYDVICAPGVLYYFNEQKILFDTGLEFGYNLIYLNAGYRINADELKSYVGLRLLIKNMVLTYAFVPGTYFDPAHRFNIIYRFESKTTPKRLQKAVYKKRKAKKSKKLPSKSGNGSIKKKRKYFKEGQDLFKKKKYKKSIKVFEKLLKIDPDHKPSKGYIRRAKKALKGGK